MAKNGWKLSKREKVGVGQSDMVNNILCRYCFQVHVVAGTMVEVVGTVGFC